MSNLFQEIIDPVSRHSDHNYSVASISMTTTLPHEVSSTSISFGPHQPYDKNWSSLDLPSLETREKMTETLVIGQKDLIEDVKITTDRVIDNTLKHTKGQLSFCLFSV